MTNKEKQLRWLLANMDKIEIDEVYPEEITHDPVLLIKIADWNMVNTSPLIITADPVCIASE
ncbi:MAG: hypothetical protein GX963_04655 [Bacteroidales bacterium]|nr:hypothetical protein [Bacteroidales bacterium]